MSYACAAARAVSAAASGSAAPWMPRLGSQAEQLALDPLVAPASGTGSAPACAHVPAKVAGEISAPCLPSPVTSEFMLRPAANRSVSNIAMNPLVNRPLPIAFGGPGAITVAGTLQSQARR